MKESLYTFSADITSIADCLRITSSQTRWPPISLCVKRASIRMSPRRIIKGARRNSLVFWNPVKWPVSLR